MIKRSENASECRTAPNPIAFRDGQERDRGGAQVYLHMGTQWPSGRNCGRLTSTCPGKETAATNYNRLLPCGEVGWCCLNFQVFRRSWK